MEHTFGGNRTLFVYDLSDVSTGNRPADKSRPCCRNEGKRDVLEKIEGSMLHAGDDKYLWQRCLKNNNYYYTDVPRTGRPLPPPPSPSQSAKNQRVAAFISHRGAPGRPSGDPREGRRVYYTFRVSLKRRGRSLRQRRPRMVFMFIMAADTCATCTTVKRVYIRTAVVKRHISRPTVSFLPPTRQWSPATRPVLLYRFSTRKLGRPCRTANDRRRVVSG